MQEISIKRPTRGTPEPAAPAVPPVRSTLILPEEPESTNTPPAGEDETPHPDEGASQQATNGTPRRKVFIRTSGCQMNEYDSDKMVDVLRQSHRAERVNRPEEADIILFNTCSVREKAQEK